MLLRFPIPSSYTCSLPLWAPLLSHCLSKVEEHSCLLALQCILGDEAPFPKLAMWLALTSSVARKGSNHHPKKSLVPVNSFSVMTVGFQGIPHLIPAYVQDMRVCESQYGWWRLRTIVWETLDKAYVDSLRSLSFATHNGEFLERDREGASREGRGQEAKTLSSYLLW